MSCIRHTCDTEHSGIGGGWAIATAQSDPRYADITFDNSDAPSGGRGYPLSYRIKATVTSSGYTYYADMTQDEKSQLRQQYVDLTYDHFPMPTRAELSLTGPSEFIDATSPAYWNAGIEATVSDIESSYDHTFTIVSSGGSGFRCPIHNEEVSTATPKKNSHHAYGRAADCHFKDENGNGSYEDEWVTIKGILDNMSGIWYKEERVEDDPVYSTGWFHLQIPD